MNNQNNYGFEVQRRIIFGRLRNDIFSYIVILLVLILISQISNAQATYPHLFNPAHEMVHETEKPYRDELCLNGKWQFMPVYETDLTKFIKPEQFHWEAVPLKIPSPWNVNSFAEGDGGDFVTYPSYPKEWEKAQMGWMKKEFVLPENWDEKEVKLHFEAIAGWTKIYVNGYLAGENFDIFFPTELDITSFLKKGVNEIIVGVAKASLQDKKGPFGRRNYVAGSFWGQHIVGIWQDVSLIAIPKLNISNIFVQPNVVDDELKLTITIQNNTTEDQEIQLSTTISEWEKGTVGDIGEVLVDKGRLKSVAMHLATRNKQIIKAGKSITMTLSAKVKGRLKLWTPDFPNLYGAVVRLKTDDNKILDSNFTRFGWRQFSIDGSRLLLNGDPIILKGDSWHFMGIPQMTRRYAWAWFRMLKDANANAVRLHAQPYPSFYLDVADEMGICVLDESGIWASDGGPKIDSEEYWEACENHIRNLVMRDRNHPSVFGWSVCNETLPVAVHVFHAPENIVQRQVAEINNWVKIVKELDPTRDWISGDGEDLRPTDLPTVIGHYGDENSMKRWSLQGKPWGVGETGMAYYGTPKQVSVINGNCAYESQLGRMEGLALEAYGLIGNQQKYGASYQSIFNLIWYGLKPLPLGLKDVSCPPEQTDGIFFSTYKEGIPGVQPERLGPYCSTLNPGYDPNLPLYDPWPLFTAVQAIYAVPPKPFNIERDCNISLSFPSSEKIGYVKIFCGQDSELKAYLTQLGVPFVDNNFINKQLRGMIIIDGKTANLSQLEKQSIVHFANSGGKVLVWGILPKMLPQINDILPHPLELTERQATSFLVKTPDEFVAGLEHKNFYFTELTRQPVMIHGLGGKLVETSSILVEACNTDWSRWNSRPEYLKTASVYRSELENKPSGAAIVKVKIGKGEMYINNIDLLTLGSEGDSLCKTMLTNLGILLNESLVNEGQVLSLHGNLTSVGLLKDCRFNEVGKMSNDEFIKVYKEKNNPIKIKYANVDDYFDFDHHAQVCLSFWIYSSRSLTDLLVEPDMPKLNLLIEGNHKTKVSINGRVFFTATQESRIENLPLEKGWNHIILQLNSQGEGSHWKTKVRFESNQENFLNQLRFSVNPF